jgi:hypothetical protein
MSDPVPSFARRHRRAFLASAAGAVVAAGGYGLTRAVRAVHMSAARAKDT